MDRHCIARFMPKILSGVPVYPFIAENGEFFAFGCHKDQYGIFFFGTVHTKPMKNFFSVFHNIL